MEIYHCSFVEALKIINQDFGLGLDTSFPKPERYTLIADIPESYKPTLDVVTAP